MPFFCLNPGFRPFSTGGIFWWNDLFLMAELLFFLVWADPAMCHLTTGSWTPRKFGANRPSGVPGGRRPTFWRVWGGGAPHDKCQGCGGGGSLPLWGPYGPKWGPRLQKGKKNKIVDPVRTTMKVFTSFASINGIDSFG